MTSTTQARPLPPLGLYVHIPWCERKCPYCDFPSQVRPPSLPEQAYVAALLTDLADEIARLDEPRDIETLFIGGGTPSLLSGPSIEALLDAIRRLANLAPDAEITLEVNPGTSDAGRLAAYRMAGVNRLSIGVQSFSDIQLRHLGRIHDARTATATIVAARDAGFANVNLDLMFGLPHQTDDDVQADIETAIALTPEHISYYELTIEPGTPFGRRPPVRPNEDGLAEGLRHASASLERAGFRQYEVSAWAQPGHRCRHNLNYWTFGDYLGIGAGAHGKLTRSAPWSVERSHKNSSPEVYLAVYQGHRTSGPASGRRQRLSDDVLVLEFMINALRLTDGFPPGLFEARTGIPLARIRDALDRAHRDQLLEFDEERIRPTDLGRTFLDDLLHRFTR
ncbi:radical SAM family heme chaperone HemW [Thioalkalicoccus limnaeus]|uniref:Heme chaperone HemW n=1 Tax=Thioalkalicoccus limnaeus TaxID=120681 RepID=A0ABV4BG77_9GAMM